MKKFPKNLNTILLIFIAVCSLVTMIFVLCIYGKVQSIEREEPYMVVSPTSATPSESQNEEPTETSTQTLTEENPDAFVVSTPYISLVFPKDYEQKLHCEESREGEGYSNTFYCLLTDTKVELFTVHFNRAFEGDLFGYLSQDGQRIPFTISFPGEQNSESWTEEEEFTVRAMQEAVNYVIDSVMTDSRYISD